MGRKTRIHQDDYQPLQRHEIIKVNRPEVMPIGIARKVAPDMGRVMLKNLAEELDSNGSLARDVGRVALPILWQQEYYEMAKTSPIASSINHQRVTDEIDYAFPDLFTKQIEVNVERLLQFGRNFKLGIKVSSPALDAQRNDLTALISELYQSSFLWQNYFPYITIGEGKIAGANLATLEESLPDSLTLEPGYVLGKTTMVQKQFVRFR